MTENQPHVPEDSMDGNAISMNEVVESYVRAGFSRAEAMDLLKQHIWTNAHIAAEQARWERQAPQ
jgi:hypothetical protein